MPNKVGQLNGRWPMVLRAIFNRVSTVIRDCFGFASLRSVIGLENSRHPLNQSDAKLKAIVVTRFFPRLRAFTCIYFEFSLVPCDIYLSSDWLL